METSRNRLILILALIMFTLVFSSCSYNQVPPPTTGGQTTTTFWSQEFLYPYAYTVEPWRALALSGGTISTTGWGQTRDTPGLIRILSHASTVNSGYNILTSTSALIFGGSEKSHYIFSPSNSTGTVIRLGFFDSSTLTPPSDGAYIEIVDGVLKGIITEASAGSNTTLTNYTVETLGPSNAGTWYNAYITINENASGVTFELYDSPQTTLLWNETIIDEPKMPNSAWRYFGNGVAAFMTTPNGASEIMKLDYIDLHIDRELDR